MKIAPTYARMFDRQNHAATTMAAVKGRKPMTHPAAYSRTECARAGPRLTRTSSATGQIHHSRRDHPERPINQDSGRRSIQDGKHEGAQQYRNARRGRVEQIGNNIKWDRREGVEAVRNHRIQAHNTGRRSHTHNESDDGISPPHSPRLSLE